MKNTILCLIACLLAGVSFHAAAQGLAFITNTFAVGPAPQGVTVADLNGDGHLDLITPNFNNKTLTVLTNNGYGGFGSNATVNVGKQPDGVAIIDVNGDGKPDLISVNYGDSTLMEMSAKGVVFENG